MDLNDLDVLIRKLEFEYNEHKLQFYYEICQDMKKHRDFEIDEMLEVLISSDLKETDPPYSGSFNLFKKRKIEMNYKTIKIQACGKNNKLIFIKGNYNNGCLAIQAYCKSKSGEVELWNDVSVNLDEFGCLPHFRNIFAYVADHKSELINAMVSLELLIPVDNQFKPRGSFLFFQEFELSRKLNNLLCKFENF